MDWELENTGGGVMCQCAYLDGGYNVAVGNADGYFAASLYNAAGDCVADDWANSDNAADTIAQAENAIAALYGAAAIYPRYAATLDNDETAGTLDADMYDAGETVAHAFGMTFIDAMNLVYCVACDIAE